MTSTETIKTLSYAGGAVVVIFSIILFFLPITPFGNPATNQPQVVQSTRSVLAAPIRLKIPAISVNAAVESSGIAVDGSMAVPVGPDDVAWYDPGARPGEIGSAVIVGHSGWKDNIPAVFDNLYQLNIGDKIYVEDTFGTTTVFTVRKTRTYDPSADATTIFSSGDGKAHLNLITCAGTWNSFSRSTSERLVVFTDEVTSTSSPQTK